MLNRAAVGAAAVILVIALLTLWYLNSRPEPEPATGYANVTWAPPTEREDGTPLAAVRGYRIYFGRDPGNLEQSVEVGPEATEHRIENLEPGTWYFAVIAISADGLESERSAVLEKTIEPP